EGARPRRRSRCHWIVSAPASSPWAKTSVRRWTISWVTSGCSAVAERCGRRDRGARPASPSVRYRPSSLYSQLRCTPCTRASSATERPSRRCASTKYGPTSIRRPPQRGVSDVLTHPSQDCRRCPELPHPPGYSPASSLGFYAVRLLLGALLCCEGHLSAGRFSFRALRDAVNGDGARRRSSNGLAFVYRSTTRPVDHPPSAIRSKREPEPDRWK